MKYLSTQKYIEDVTYALPTEEREERQSVLRRELGLLTEVYLERGKNLAEAEQAVIAHHDPAYASVTRTRVRQEAAFALITSAALSLLAVTLLQIFGVLDQQPQTTPDISSSATAKPVDVGQGTALTELGTFRSMVVTPPPETSGYTLFLMQGNKLVAVLPGNVYLNEPSASVRVTFGPERFVHHRCGQRSSFYIASVYGNAHPHEAFVCYKRAGERADVPPMSAPYLAAFEAALESQPLPLIRRDKDDIKVDTWIPLLAHYEKRYGWRSDDIESLYLKSVPVEEWYVLYLMFYQDEDVAMATLEPPSLQTTLASENNLLSLWREIEQGLETSP